MLKAQTVKIVLRTSSFILKTMNGQATDSISTTSLISTTLKAGATDS